MKVITRDGKAYCLESEHNKVSYLMKAGNDMVRNVMSENGALGMMKVETLTENDEHPGYPICVNGTFFFPGKVEDVNEPAPEPKARKRR